MSDIPVDPNVVFAAEKLKPKQVVSFTAELPMLTTETLASPYAWLATQQALLTNDVFLQRVLTSVQEKLEGVVTETIVQELINTGLSKISETADYAELEDAVKAALDGLAQLDKKLDKTGGIVSGGLTVNGAFTANYPTKINNELTVSGINGSGKAYYDLHPKVMDFGSTSGELNIDFSRYVEFKVAPTGPVTFNLYNPPSTGVVGYCYIEIKAPGTNQLTFKSMVWSGNEVPSFSPTLTTVVAIRYSSNKAVAAVLLEY